MAASSDGTLETLELTADNIELVLDEVRPYLVADGGDVELVEIDGLSVKLKLKGACGSCPSSTVTMRMGIEKRLLEKIPDIMEVIQVEDELEVEDANERLHEFSSRASTPPRLGRVERRARGDE